MMPCAPGSFLQGPVRPRLLSPIKLLRFVSSSPYGRTHVWRRRPPKLPPPVVPQFPQRVTLADGSTFVHWTTSPRSSIRLTKDTTNSPMWNPWMEGGDAEELEGTTGRLGRFRRRFEELGGTDIQTEWIEGNSEERPPETVKSRTSTKSTKTSEDVKA